MKLLEFYKLKEILLRSQIHVNAEHYRSSKFKQYFVTGIIKTVAELRRYGIAKLLGIFHQNLLHEPPSLIRLISASIALAMSW